MRNSFWQFPDWKNWKNSAQFIDLHPKKHWKCHLYKLNVYKHHVLKVMSFSRCLLSTVEVSAKVYRWLIETIEVTTRSSAFRIVCRFPFPLYLIFFKYNTHLLFSLYWCLWGILWGYFCTHYYLEMRRVAHAITSRMWNSGIPTWSLTYRWVKHERSYGREGLGTSLASLFCWYETKILY